MLTVHRCEEDTRYIDNDKFLMCPVCKIPLEAWEGAAVSFESNNGDDYLGDDNE